MGNEFLTIKNIARQTLPRLIESLVFPNLIHRDYSEDFAFQGDTIQVRKPVTYKATEFNQATGTSAQDVKEESVDVTLNHLATVDIEFTAIQRATNVDDLNRLFLEPAAVALAEKINSDGLGLYVDLPYIAGTAGTTPDGLDDFAAARRILNQNKVPLTQRRAVWDVEADAKFTTVDGLVKVNEAGTARALREGEIGRVFGLDNYMSQAVKTHAKGTLATAGTAGKKILLKGAAAAAVQVILDTDDSALTGTLKKGDILTFTPASGTAQQVIVTADATAEDNEIVVKLYPALTAADNAVVTITANHTANLAFHENAFAFVTRPLVAPAGVESYVTSFNGITMRVVRGYDMKYKKEMLSMDILYGYKTMYPELAVRYLG